MGGETVCFKYANDCQERTKQCGVEELGSSQSGLHKTESVVRQRGGVLPLLPR